MKAAQTPCLQHLIKAPTLYAAKKLVAEKQMCAFSGNPMSEPQLQFCCGGMVCSQGIFKEQAGEIASRLFWPSVLNICRTSAAV
jgi:hypothetical protein